MSHDNWKKRLEIAQTIPTVKERHAAVAALKINFTQPTEADEGYYRKPTFSGDRTNGGKLIITGYVPISYWMEGGKLCGVIGIGEDHREMTADELTNEEIWSYAVQNPVSYMDFCAVAYEDKPWPDMVRRVTENQTAAAEEAKAPVTLEEHRAAIKALVDGAKEISIQSNEDVAIWTGTKNLLAEKRLAADKAGRAIYEPLYAQYTAEQKAWSPMVKAAQQTEHRIVACILTFREKERRKEAAAQAERDRLAREAEEAQQRAADRAIARGEPEPEPEVGEDTIVETAPPPAAIQPTFGTRTVKEEVKIFLDKIVDEAALCAHFRGHPDLVAVLRTLAEREIKRGITVPGITTREGLI